MSYDEANDDFGMAKPPYKVIAAIAVHGRLPLLKHTIERLYKKNGCFKVICAGDNPNDKVLCESLGAVWVNVRNKPLGNKWNQAFFKAKEFNPDAVLYVGSSDWVCNDWINIMRPYVERYGFAGVAGCSLLDIGELFRACHWPGYGEHASDRSGETIGSGRMLSRRLLDAIGWLPFDHDLNNSLDWSMKKRSEGKNITDFMVNDDRLKSLSISTSGPYTWPKGHENKHKFWHHWNDLPNGKQFIPSEKIDAQSIIDSYFPEAKLIFV